MRHATLLINPNTNDATTRMMVAIAQDEAGDRIRIDGLSAPFGAPLIVDEGALDEAARAVESLAGEIDQRAPAAVIIAAFGDPGLEALRKRFQGPVSGIAEASMAEASLDEQGAPRRFAVVTTTPLLVQRIAARADAYGYREWFTGTRLTPGDPTVLMAHRESLAKALETACREAVEHDGAQALVIGGGPLALVARELRGRFSVPLIEPVPAAVRLTIKRLETPAHRG